jgi:hydroxylamine reductase
VDFDEASIIKKIKMVNAEHTAIDPVAAKNDIFDMQKIWQADDDIRSLKSLVLFGVRGIAAYAYHAAVLGYNDSELAAFFYKALSALSEEKYGMNELLPLVMETGKMNFQCMEMLDKANTSAFGHPVPVKVSTTIEAGPFIVISGHDLYDLKLLLEQTQDKGINIYTHGEMLPAHAYPALKAYPHLKGNFGGAWQNQQKEFAALPAPVLFTTNCIMPVKESYRDRVFTSGPVSFPGVPHIGESKDWTPLIKKAYELGGYKNVYTTSENKHLTTGFAHNAVLGAAETIISAVKSGDIKHFFLVGGCDGAEDGRNYYTEFVKQTPKDTIILTLACGKYRFNNLDLGEIGGLPRILDIGQCNDAYSAIKIALALADAFKCGVNDLPLTLVLSWYEQKAVSILLTLLHLGIKNILLGPSLPAFVSPNVLKYLIDNFNIKPISTPAEDLISILKN